MEDDEGPDGENWLFNNIMAELKALPGPDAVQRWRIDKLYACYADGLTQEQAESVEREARKLERIDTEVHANRHLGKTVVGNLALNALSDPLPVRRKPVDPTPPPRPIEKVRPRGWVRKPPRNQRQKRRSVISSGRLGHLLKAILCEDLTETEKAVLIVIIFEMHQHGVCRLANATIAERAGCCIRMVRYAVIEGEKLGLFTVQHRPIPGGRKSLTNMLTPSRDLWNWLKHRKEWEKINVQDFACAEEIKNKEYCQEESNSKGEGKGAAEGQAAEASGKNQTPEGEILDPEPHRQRETRQNARREFWERQNLKRRGNLDDFIAEVRKMQRGGRKSG
jgi:hypothetical protein